MPARTSYDLDAASIFKTALATARRTRTSVNYRTAAQWADKAAAEAPYGSKESFWIQADELNAMANALSTAEARKPSHATIAREIIPGRVTLKNAQQIVLFYNPKLTCQPYRASRLAKKTYWISADGHTSLGEGSTPAAAWKAAAEKLRAGG